MPSTWLALSTFLNAQLDAGRKAEHFADPAAPVPTYLPWALPPPLIGSSASPHRPPGHRQARH